MQDKETKRKEKVAKAIRDKKIVDDSSFATFQMVEDLNDRLDEELPKVQNILNDLLPRIKGDKGDNPTEEELLELILPLIPEQLIPENGKDYILTEEDKQKIAQSIKVPIVEKEVKTIIEKTEVIRETPIVTNNVIEKALYEEPNQIVAKVNSATDLIDNSKIKGFSDLEKISKMNAFNPTMGPSFSDLVKKQDKLIAGTNITINGNTISSTGGSGGGPTLQTNGTPNGSQSLLNLKNGTNVTITDDGSGGVTINSSGSGGSGTVTSVASADGSVIVTNPTTTADLAVVKAPILSTARTIAGVSFNGSANIAIPASGLSNGVTGSGAVVLAVSPAMTGTPTAPTQSAGDNTTAIATDAFVSTAVANGIASVNAGDSVDYATSAILPNSPIYNNGASGVGATITTLTTNVALVVDGGTPTIGQEVLVKNEGDGSGLGASRNGIYVLTTPASLGVAWILTRATDYNSTNDINNLGLIYTRNGGTTGGSTGNAGISYALVARITTVGTDSITYQVGAPAANTIVTLAGIQTVANKTLPTPIISGTAAVDGALGFDSTQHTPTYYSSVTASLGFIPRVMSIVLPGTALTNSTTSDQDYSAVYTIPANALISGKTYRVTLFMRMTTGVSSATILLYLKVGGTKMYTTVALNQTDSIDRWMSCQFTIMGTAAASGSASVQVGSIMTPLASGIGGAQANSIAPQNLATNGTLAIVPGITFGSTGSTETITLLSSITEELSSN